MGITLKMCAVQKHLKQPISRIVEGLRPPKNEAAGKQLAAGIAATAMAIRLLPEVHSMEGHGCGGCCCQCC